jgi:hypothetical protein
MKKIGMQARVNKWRVSSTRRSLPVEHIISHMTLIGCELKPVRRLQVILSAENPTEEGGDDGETTEVHLSEVWPPD